MNETQQQHQMPQAQSTRKELKQRRDAINGHPVNILLNTPWTTLPQEGMLQRGQDARDLVEHHNARFGRLVENNQLFVSPFPGSLLETAVDIALDTLPQESRPPETVTHICVPLDRGYYLCAYDHQMNGLIPGEETILDDDTEIMPLFESDRLYFIRGGIHSERFNEMFDDNIEITPDQIQAWELKPIRLELLRNLLLTRNALIQMAAGGLALLFSIWFLLSWMFQPEPPFVPPPQQDPGPPMGAALATPQLQWANDVISELVYFSDKSLLQADISPYGATIQGALPTAAVLHRFVGELAAADLDITFGAGGGWTVTTPGVDVTPEIFVLGSFTNSVVAVQAAAESLGYELAMTAPVTTAQRQNATVTLTPIIPGTPNLDALAAAISGYPVTLQNIQFLWDESVLPNSVSVTLTIEGLP